MCCLMVTDRCSPGLKLCACVFYSFRVKYRFVVHTWEIWGGGKLDQSSSAKLDLSRLKRQVVLAGTSGDGGRNARFVYFSLLAGVLFITVVACTPNERCGHMGV